MTLFEAMLLGILQGLTEFLPVSSSGHLVLAQQFLGLAEHLVFFDVMLHVGTLLAVLVVYRQTLAKLLTASLSTLSTAQFYRNPLVAVNASIELRCIMLILIGTIPTAGIALLFKSDLESLFGDVHRVSVMLIVTGIILQLPRLRRQGVEAGDVALGTIRMWHAVCIGIAQGCAIVPGISRSGTTISLALFLGIPSKTAAAYSFLLAIPAILGAVIIKVSDIGELYIPYYILVAGMGVAFVVGYSALRFLLAVLNRGKFSIFSYYCVVLGLVALYVVTF